MVDSLHLLDLQPIREMKICMPGYIATDFSQVRPVPQRNHQVNQNSKSIKISYPLNTRTICTPILLSRQIVARKPAFLKKEFLDDVVPDGKISPTTIAT